MGIRPSTVERHLADLRARSGLTAEQLIYAGRAAGLLDVPSLEPKVSRPNLAHRFLRANALGLDGHEPEEPGVWFETSGTSYGQTALLHPSLRPDPEEAPRWRSRNKAVVRRFFDEALSNGALGILDEICSPDYRLYSTLSGPDAIDRDGVKELVRSFLVSFPDARITIEDIVAEGDLVAARMMEQGTHAGTFREIPPTGRRVTYGSMTFLRVVDGRIVEHWGLLDLPSLLEQLQGPRG